jgi:hypothetical protein
MSWPVRASLFRARELARWADQWLVYGDPPFLGGIAERCNHLHEVEPRGRILQITPPSRLSAAHARLADAYSTARAACVQARRRALAARTALDHYYNTRSAADLQTSDHALAVARRDISALAHVTLRSFSRRVSAWRWAVLAELAALGMPPPSWLDELVTR